MKIENYKCFSLTKNQKFKPEEFIKGRLERVDYVLKSFKKIKPEDLNIYVSNLNDKINEIVGDYAFDVDVFNWNSINQDLSVLPNFPELEKLVFLFVCKTINLPENYVNEQGEIETIYFDLRKAIERTSYYLVRTLADIYGKEEGTEIYKQIAPNILNEYISKAEREKPKDVAEEPIDPKTIMIHDFNKNSTEAWCKVGLVDCTSCILDDYKVVYRFEDENFT
ncbi:MAG: hypothetical protein ACFFDS_10375 [Candidatus Thorarchaeota archaeon]